MKSMTGFGKAIRMTANEQIEVEVKSVNHRFLDIQVRTTRQLHAFENQIRQMVKRRLHRGRIEVYVTLTQSTSQSKTIQIDWDLIEQVVQSVETETKHRFQTAVPLGSLVERLLEKEAFFQIQEVPLAIETVEGALLEALAEATEKNEASRQVEGAGILAVLLENQALLQTHVADLFACTALFETEYRSRFEKKLEAYLGSTIDQERLLTELVLLLERSDIREELDRMQIHLASFNELVMRTQPVGRELDFLIQEMNREVNTIGSKSTAIEIKHHVVQMKTIIEKIREQVQNIE
ncbi:YicC/YloC family endoribonuclease [Enterococcus sp. LJL98]